MSSRLRPRPARLAAALFCALFCLACGCGKKGNPHADNVVTGKVVFGKQEAAVPFGMVQFFSMESGNKLGEGAINQGNYQVAGVPPGEVVVVVSMSPGGSMPGGMPGGMQGGGGMRGG